MNIKLYFTKQCTDEAEARCFYVLNHQMYQLKPLIDWNLVCWMIKFCDKSCWCICWGWNEDEIERYLQSYLHNYCRYHNSLSLTSFHQLVSNRDQMKILPNYLAMHWICRNLNHRLSSWIKLTISSVSIQLFARPLDYLVLQGTWYGWGDARWNIRRKFCINYINVHLSSHPFSQPWASRMAHYSVRWYRVWPGSVDQFRLILYLVHVVFLVLSR